MLLKVVSGFLGWPVWYLLMIFHIKLVMALSENTSRAAGDIEGLVPEEHILHCHAWEKWLLWFILLQNKILCFSLLVIFVNLPVSQQTWKYKQIKNHVRRYYITIQILCCTCITLHRIYHTCRIGKSKTYRKKILFYNTFIKVGVNLSQL